MARSNRYNIVTDIDHVISNSFWRDSMLANSPVDWNAYHAASIDDEPITDVINMLESAAMMDASIITITARPEKWRKLTMGWMIKHQVPSDALLMRPDDVFQVFARVK